ncbi:MAG: GntR family transcriptional regulator [Burkholderiales bacterium]|nr:GntR family transcriptional regulator [Burkholderiales bacterium]GIK86151.1 MAG: GntR family transcriptional regulator [Betaproteobacteria bacterium]
MTASRRTPADDATGSLVDAAYQTMRRRILDNAWAPGYRALEQAIALELGMSRTPVREALIRLANEGLVEVVPRHGMRVLPVSAADMNEIYQVLGSLEATAAELVAARRPAAAEIAPLEAASRAMAEALKRGDLDAWAEADERFHRHLVELCGNRLLAATVNNFWDRAHRARMFTLRLRPLPVHSTREHRDLVRAIRKGDVGTAREIHRAHRDRGRRELTAILDRYRLPTL